MKRFTETDKWRDAWYRGLSPVHKCLWNYFVDNCDQAGVIDPDWELISFQIGAQVSELDLCRFEKQLDRLPSGKLFIAGFVAFQYGQLSTDCKPHKPVFAALERHGIKIERVSKGYPKGIQYLQEKDKEKEKEKDKDRKEVQEETKTTASEVYESYPRKIARKESLKAIEKVVSQGIDAAYLLEKTKAYAAVVAQWPESDRGFIPYPATWFNRGSYDDDPKEWVRSSGKAHHNTNVPSSILDAF
jgi:hypothetical protein